MDIAPDEDVQEMTESESPTKSEMSCHFNSKLEYKDNTLTFDLTACKANDASLNIKPTSNEITMDCAAQFQPLNNSDIGSKQANDGRESDNLDFGINTADRAAKMKLELNGNQMDACTVSDDSFVSPVAISFISEDAGGLVDINTNFKLSESIQNAAEQISKSKNTKPTVEHREKLEKIDNQTNSFSFVLGTPLGHSGYHDNTCSAAASGKTYQKCETGNDSSNVSDPSSLSIKAELKISAYNVTNEPQAIHTTSKAQFENRSIELDLLVDKFSNLQIRTDINIPIASNVDINHKRTRDFRFYMDLNMSKYKVHIKTKKMPNRRKLNENDIHSEGNQSCDTGSIQLKGNSRRKRKMSEENDRSKNFILYIPNYNHLY